MSELPFSFFFISRFLFILFVLSCVALLFALYPVISFARGSHAAVITVCADVCRFQSDLHKKKSDKKRVVPLDIGFSDTVGIEDHPSAPTK